MFCYLASFVMKNNKQLVHAINISYDKFLAGGNLWSSMQQTHDLKQATLIEPAHYRIGG